jgi:hypothetical protein
MKLQKLIPYLFALLLVTSLSGCDKDDKDKVPSKRDLLTAGEWNGQAIYVYGNNESQLFKDEIDYDIMKRKVKYDKAGTYVDRYERRSLSGTWEFTSDEQSLIFDKGTADEYTARVTSLTAKEFHIEEIIETEEGSFPLEFRFSRP